MKYNEILSQLSERYGYVYYVDVYEDFLHHNEYYLDRTHMNEIGYEKMAQAIVSMYQQSIGNRS